MKRVPVLFLALMLVFCASAASAQSARTVYCPPGGFTLTLPDNFAEVPVTSPDDPDLALHLTDGNINLAVYVSWSGTENSFQVLTGNEIEYGPVIINGVEMFYTRGLDEQGNWITYSWMQAPNSVTVYFVWYGNDNETLMLINEIMASIVFDK